MLNKLEPIIRSITDSLIDDIVEAGTNTFELMTQLAFRVPNRVICHIMGVEVSDETRYLSWLDGVNNAATMGERDPERLRDQVLQGLMQSDRQAC